MGGLNFLHNPFVCVFFLGGGGEREGGGSEWEGRGRFKGNIGLSARDTKKPKVS